jgi:hypothetical protein
MPATSVPAYRLPMDQAGYSGSRMGITMGAKRRRSLLL